jgi:NitT/TauT family transport system substrate-binding protein
LRKTQSFPISVVAPTLFRSVDLQQEWGRLLKREARMPQAGMAVINRKLDDAVIRRFTEEYAKATQWCLDNPEEAGKIVAARIDLLTPEAVADSIKVAQFRHVPAQEARPELEHFFGVLHETTPALIGGKLPDDGFYYQ